LAALVRIPIAIAAGIVFFAARFVLGLFRGVDKYESAGISQAGDDRSDDAGGHVDGADKRASIGGGIRGAWRKSILFQRKDGVQLFVGKKNEACD
jgi:hypothetical protein